MDILALEINAFDLMTKIRLFYKKKNYKFYRLVILARWLY